ncbi:MAG TPA: hypothetical protein PL120_02895 [Bacilli bacterium]|nr:hypothetical protein [Bacilli bacterium]HPK86123.1 hypothetical protein [Bacilli bacterium]
MSKKKEIKNIIVSALVYLLVMLGATIAFTVVVDFFLPLSLLFMMLISLIAFIFARGNLVAIFTPSTLFLPLIYIHMHQGETLSIGSVTWQISLGQFLVAMWISGIIYILGAIVIHLVKDKVIKKIFPPLGISALTIAILLKGIALISYETLSYDFGTYNQTIFAVVGFLGAFLASLLIRFLTPNKSFFHRIYMFFGLFVGILLVFIAEGIGMLTGLDISETLLLAKIVNLEVSHPLHFLSMQYLGHLDKLLIDWDLFLIVIPTAIIGVLHVYKLTVHINEDESQLALTKVEAERLFFTSAIANMSCGLFSAPSVYTNTYIDKSSNKKVRVYSILLFALLTLVLLFIPQISAFFLIVPMSIYFALLISFILVFILQNARGVRKELEKNKNIRSFILFTVPLLISISLALLELYDYFNLTNFNIFYINGMRINYLLIGFVVMIMINIVNIIISAIKRKKENKNVITL